MTAPLDDPAATPGRRRVLRLLASLPLLGGPGGTGLSDGQARLTPLADPSIPADPFHGGAKLLVPGPPQAPLHRWARLAAAALAEGLPPGSAVSRISVGGPDGVTAANQFGARTTPDGHTLLLAPGASVLAWLVGESRVKFDVGGWVPVGAAVSPGVLVGRFGPDALRGGKVLRLAVDRLPGPELAGLLSLALLGGVPHPVTGLGPDAAEVALLRGALDAVLLTGEGVLARAGRLAAHGLLPVVSFGSVGTDGALERDPAFPTVPQLAELATALHGKPPAGPLFRAWCGTAAAAQLAFGLQLPALTPAGMVALWRRASGTAMQQPALAAALQGQGLRSLTGPAALANARNLAVDTPALLALRQWLSTHRDWRIG
jgi:hypothetical protein